MSALTRPDRGEALERLTAMTRELGDQAETYLLLCMSILAHNAPDVASFVMDRADDKLDALADDPRTSPGLPEGGGESS